MQGPITSSPNFLDVTPEKGERRVLSFAKKNPHLIARIEIDVLCISQVIKLAGLPKYQVPAFSGRRIPQIEAYLQEGLEGRLLKIAAADQR